MQLTAILALATTAACSALPAQIPAGVEYTQVSAAHISESISMAAPAFNETAVILIESRDRELSKRANHGVYLCVDTGFSGYCVHIVAPAGVCGKYTWLAVHAVAGILYMESGADISFKSGAVPLGSDLNDKVSAVGPNAGAYCRFYL
ncbi:hypothetical protein FJTKL_13112 [Diaporthe vaccinii]|uniref:Uncharacterized protein n=1 Tax=Diaporthe vaccinii TaxID=105482 RepID=A0ABR4EC38_9PEZI